VSPGCCDLATARGGRGADLDGAGLVGDKEAAAGEADDVGEPAAVDGERSANSRPNGDEAASSQGPHAAPPAWPEVRDAWSKTASSWEAEVAESAARPMSSLTTLETIKPDAPEAVGTVHVDNATGNRKGVLASCS
jgi:hypothetical protein